MTDEEMAEQFADGIATPDLEASFRAHIFEASKDGFLAGLKAGRPQWHNLRENPNDLPKEFDINKNRWEMEKRITEHIVQNQDGERVCCLNGKWYYEEGGEAYVIAWCEIHTFDKE